MGGPTPFLAAVWYAVDGGAHAADRQRRHISSGKARSPMADTLAESVRELVAELEARFPYAAALLTGATGTQITDDGREQSASEVDPSRGIVFTVYDGSAFAEYSTSDLTSEHLAARVRGWAGELSPRPGGPPLASERAPPPTTAEPPLFGVPLDVDPPPL